MYFNAQIIGFVEHTSEYLKVQDMRLLCFSQTLKRHIPNTLVFKYKYLIYNLYFITGLF